VCPRDSFLTPDRHSEKSPLLSPHQPGVDERHSWWSAKHAGLGWFPPSRGIAAFQGDGSSAAGECFRLRLPAGHCPKRFSSSASPKMGDEPGTRASPAGRFHDDYDSILHGPVCGMEGDNVPSPVSTNDGSVGGGWLQMITFLPASHGDHHHPRPARPFPTGRIPATTTAMLQIQRFPPMSRLPGSTTSLESDVGWRHRADR
jgi:hypothetical protein